MGTIQQSDCHYFIFIAVIYLPKADFLSVGPQLMVLFQMTAALVNGIQLKKEGHWCHVPKQNVGTKTSFSFLLLPGAKEEGEWAVHYIVCLKWVQSDRARRPLTTTSETKVQNNSFSFLNETTFIFQQMTSMLIIIISHAFRCWSVLQSMCYAFYFVGILRF